MLLVEGEGGGETGRSGKEYYAIKVEISSEDRPRRTASSEYWYFSGDGGKMMERNDGKVCALCRR